jgi:integrase/recombinase XerD
MMVAERGAARATLAAYADDLTDAANFLTRSNVALDTADAAALRRYVASLAGRGLSVRTSARRLSVLRQFYRFLALEGARPDDPTAGIDAPRLGRPLPKLLSHDEMKAMIEAAGRREKDAPLALCIVELL